VKFRAKISRRDFVKSIVGSSLLVAILGPTYSFFFERTWYQVNHIKIPILGPNSQFKGLRIVQFSDIHYGHYFGLENLKEVVDRINQLDADLVCFTGDLVDSESDEIEESIQALSEIKATMGKIAILGNHDYSWNVKRISNTLTSAGFKLLVNKNMIIERGPEQIYIVGIDDAIRGNPDLNQALIGTEDSQTIILLAHEPDIADSVTSKQNIKLQLSGHSHGGQIRAPLVGHMVTPPLGRKYVDGLYKIKDSNLTVYTNRGIGTTILPFRFNCRPEISVIELV
jgi:predicted MPP superfamily phosphohydrolase